MRRTNTLLIIILCLGLALGAGLGWMLKARSPSSAAVPTEDPHRILFYRNPMDPKITSDKPIKDDMGMDYLPVYADAKSAAKSDEGGIRIDPRQVQNLGVRTGLVEKRAFVRSIHTVGTVLVDERGVTTVSPKISGWLERLRVKAVGDVVEQGQVLAEIYSPELLSAQEEYRIAAQASQQMTTAGDATMRGEMQSLEQAARARLRLLDIPAGNIAALASGKSAQRTVALRAPYRGIVTELGVREGMSVSPEMRLFTLADLRQVWVNVEVYANQLPWVKVGDSVDLTLAFVPGRHWQGRIDYLYPTLNGQSRTVTARLLFDNPDGVLRPGMYANATIGADERRTVLAVPREAVLRNGLQNSVILALDEGHFQPVIVHLGAENDNAVEIIDGLKEGQKIVLSGQFLLDAEANFQGATARMQGGDAASGEKIDDPLSPRGEGQGEGAQHATHNH